jgi:protein-disulfide isomerase
VPHPEHLEGYVFALALPGLVFSGYMAYAAWFVLKVLCVLCLATYVAVAGLFLVSGLSTRFSMPKLSPRVSRDVGALRSHPVAVAVAVLVLAALAGLIGFFPRSSPEATLDAKTPPDFEAPEAAEPPEPQASQLEQYLATAPRRMIPVDVKADVVVVKFNDYQCPSCGQVHNLYKPLKQKWDREAPGRVKFVSKDFPLEPECNATIKNGLHQMACEAAAAVRMARRNNKAEPLEDWIFANQATLSLEGIKKAVRDIGGVADFDAQYSRVLNDVRIDTSLGGFLGVGSTPTFFINGVQIPDLRPAVMDAAIAAELRRIGPR